MSYIVERVTVEVVSAIACFILVRFMIKPFQLTGETRYLGLPLGFGFLGASYAYSALSYTFIINFPSNPLVQLLVRAFAFLFLATTYYFSKSKKKPQLLWNTTYGVLAAIMTTLILFVIFFPPFPASNYRLAQIYVRIFTLICLSYIAIYALKSHIEKPNPETLMIPLGYILLGIGQYSVLIWAVDGGIFAFFGSLALRVAGLVVFLYVSYRTFYSSEKRENK